MKTYDLCIPGPVKLSPAVQQAMSQPLIPHYGDVWIDNVYQPVQAMLHQVFQTRNDIFVMPSSGSGATESVFCSLSNPQRTVGILRNGFFGERLMNIARHYFPKVVDCAVPIGQPITPQVAEDFLKRNPEVSIVAVVHGETSTGVANDVQALAGVVKQKERVFVLDAVSTLGSINIEVDGWGIDFCLSASQKGVSAPPGLSFVSVSEFGQSCMPPREKIPGWYHNLRVWKDSIEEWGAWHPYPVTLPVNIFFALKVALEELLAEGLKPCFERHRRVADYFRRRLTSLGAKMFCSTPGAELDTVTAFALPEGFKSPDLLAYMRDQRGILITGGPPPHKDRVSRVGHMGYGAREEMLDKVVDGIAAFLKKA